MPGGVGELGPGGWFSSQWAGRAAESRQRAGRTTSRQSQSKKHELAKWILTSLFCTVMCSVSCTSTSPLTWPSLCSGMTLPLSVSAPDARSHQQRSVYACKPPTVHVQLANWNAGTLQKSTSTISHQEHSYAAMWITHSALSCNISSSVASRVVADLLFVSSSSFWASTRLESQK